jgi:MraZ protein
VGVSERELYQGYGLQSVDEKGRVAVPASLRGSIETNNPGDGEGKPLRKLILSTHPRENCLIGYDLRYTASLAERLTARELANPSHDGDIDYNIKRKGGGAAESLPFDASGRFILPPFPRFQAQIGAHAFFWGVLDFFEIWDPKTLIECDSATEVQKAAARFFMAEKGVAL